MSSDIAASSNVGSKATGKVRFTIVAMLFAVTMVNYADRATIAIAGPAVSKDLGLTAVQMGLVFSAFGWSYVICQIPGGWLLDRFGSKRVYFASIFIWSLFTVFQGGVWTFGAGVAAVSMLFLLRFLVGCWTGLGRSGSTSPASSSGRCSPCSRGVSGLLGPE